MAREYELQPMFDTRKSFYGKAVVKETDDKSTLYSYNTKVCEIRMTSMDDFDVVFFNVYNLWSATTTRHLKEFLKQNGIKAESKAQMQNDYMTVNV